MGSITSKPRLWYLTAEQTKIENDRSAVWIKCPKCSYNGAPAGHVLAGVKWSRVYLRCEACDELFVLPVTVQPAHMVVHIEFNRKCVECGCTDDRACVTDGQPCSWARKGRRPLCSACRDKKTIGRIRGKARQLSKGGRRA